MATQWIKNNVKNISKKTIDKKMQNPTLHDFAICIMVYDKICEKGAMKEENYLELKKLQKRFKKNSAYFTTNNLLVSSYVFIRKILHIFYKKH